jgi:hypothetical protein
MSENASSVSGNSLPTHSTYRGRGYGAYRGRGHGQGNYRTNPYINPSIAGIAVSKVVEPIPAQTQIIVQIFLNVLDVVSKVIDQMRVLIKLRVRKQNKKGSECYD